ncbi:MAG: Asp-tRNA(Asn)/Glu-tRNA(Gln) amidotransferase GatCAB subunit A [unclassified Hahellaceae]|nr:Asp-tRNA(Asn)/Glu-tRNA(Gln) amidotransferase GatCAB subunit A [Hahellaceae bacterium]|tara:strand:- start:38983 stop:40464 length:1482 start_codon:yes stop_codon:yes gene_type:complete
MFPETIQSALEGLRNGEFSIAELVTEFATRARNAQPELNAYITIATEDQLEQQISYARDLALKDAPLDLAGIPLAIKDLFCTELMPTTCGSKMLEDYVSPFESTASSRLLQTGAVFVGKTNMDEFAMGSSNENSFFGPVRNPWHVEHVPGGSSGGSAAAVAAGLCLGALGTDTGGSIRQPAAYCGITGLKPTYGRTSRYGMVAYASSLDQAGPMTRTAYDAALLLSAIAGPDDRDSTSSAEPVADYLKDINKPLQGLRVGLPKEYFEALGEGPVLNAIMEAKKTLEQQGVSFVDVSLPHSNLALSAYYIIAPAEASTNLSRFDGVRFGHRCNGARDLADLYARSRSEGFGAEVQRRILIGTFALSAGYQDAFYKQAQRVRRLVKNDFVDALGQVDLLLAPVTLGAAFRLGEKTDDPVSMYKEDLFTIPVSLAGLPAISVPCGMADASGTDLPLGMQLIGNYFDEARLLNVAHQWQQLTDWHSRTPPSSAREMK